ncbi:carbohydrate ABC transporter membrane protein 1 (CUT1 family) [Saccharopolyspora erythraea NRRL 2338]|uniref:Integral membrane transport protein n=2 Tax=Saccharopolyspora erythraea TaxID=1836 RepID=A4FQW1_SACEN|nr:sugar ABC transporter permease [Saccharopolyspora erythraea]EQD85736.1 amino acid ABC transporter permease [Saccharopolyspora erythraea D]PFG93038.1 carbohydrate ABC transporter membrane protein 1 (CUT1 family) [Saccharopolyspora erythraea NRRL 2338]QRK89920.1 sugar ABC transporter permease [Saccharopolyspora erythraea]CAM06436.1 putative integral membrane transport protein [Saccharopolyspora erythraea NRRL 2338]
MAVLRPQRVGSWLAPMAPALVLLGLFVVGPILWSCYVAFTDAALTGSGATDPQFVGLDNFRRLFADPALWHSAWLTVLFTLGSAVIGQNCLGMLIALLTRHRSRWLRNSVGIVVVSAWVLPELVAAFAIYAFLNPEGTLNNLFAAVGAGEQDWLFSAPMAAIVLGNVWRGTAFSMLVYQATLSQVPGDLSEAAEVDGAGPLRRFWHVTLPIIRGAVLTNLMLVTLQTIGMFTLIYVLTAGGPGDATQTLPLLMYDTAFEFDEIGYGATMSLVLLGIGGLFAVVYAKSLRDEV